MKILDATLVVPHFDSDQFTDELDVLIQGKLPDINGLSCGDGELHVNLYLDSPTPGQDLLRSIALLEEATGFSVAAVDIYDENGESPTRYAVELIRLVLQLQQQIPRKEVLDDIWERVAS